MAQTPLTQGLVSRLTQAARYVASGVAPDAWFGPLQPASVIAPADVAGRRFDYPVGYNLNYTPRSAEPISFDELRALADGCDILRSVIETRKDQLAAQEWTVRVAQRDASARPPQATDDQKHRIDGVLAFLQSPDRQHGFDQWLRQILEDLFVIDGVALYKRRTRAGGLYALEVMDAATIKLLLDDSGRLPAGSDPAYQQILKGVPAANYTRDELLYLVHNPRSHKVYGYSQVEQVLVTVNILIRRSMHQLEYYREGSTPDALIGLPKEWTSDQIAAFQKHFDSMLAGNLGLRRHARFMPGEFKYQETKAPPLKDAYDEFLARIICFVFSVSPEPFVGQVNRATAQTSHARATEEGLGPLMRYIRALLNRIIATEFASPDLEFAWEETRAQDPAQAAQIDVAYVGAGILTVDEVRANLGLEPIAKAQALLPPTQKYNPNHLGPGPAGGQFTSATHNGTSNGLPPGAGKPIRHDLTTAAQNASALAMHAATTAALDTRFPHEAIDESYGMDALIGLGGVYAVTEALGSEAVAAIGARAKAALNSAMITIGSVGTAVTEKFQELYNVLGDKIDEWTGENSPPESNTPNTISNEEKISNFETNSNEVARVINRALQTKGNDGDYTATKEIAEQAAKDFVGENPKQIYDRQTGDPVGEISTDRLRVARYNNAKDPDDAYINLINKETRGNLHVRWWK